MPASSGKHRKHNHMSDITAAFMESFTDRRTQTHTDTHRQTDIELANLTWGQPPGPLRTDGHHGQLLVSAALAGRGGVEGVPLWAHEDVAGHRGDLRYGPVCGDVPARHVSVGHTKGFL